SLTKASILRTQGMLAFYNEDIAATERYLRESANIYQANGQLYELVHTLNPLGSILGMIGKSSEETLQQALAYARQLGDQRGEGLVLGNIGVERYMAGDYGQALLTYEQARACAIKMGDRRAEMNSTNNLGALYFQLGDWARAKEIGKQVLAYARQMKDRIIIAKSLINVGTIAQYQAEWSTVELLGRQVVEFGTTFDHAELRCQGFLLLGKYQLANQQYDKAHAFVQQALAEGLKLETARFTLEALTNWGQMLLAQGDQATLADCAERILQLLGEHSAEYFDDIFITYATLYQLLATLNDPRATQTLNNAYHRLMQRAHKINDPTWRTSFLENHPSHQFLRAQHRKQQKFLARNVVTI
ncbi:MAG: tetratricopeptide repeat protein, partial [Methylococcales bacterium]|nr:tetratricopeptide repeat protein [Methylococcales bacterium]